ncbi:uncharacterized protein ATC70_005063 [Mucor velutinosus]|uniref:Polyadenylate-binding protein, cytoplasmic and nuclear n=2 Tax=Mucor TaxID=4830 RepID=A0AAN7D4I5_9FUNG|nr:hypothetical protein ATC70_005063 [Mucor velutinosus]
MTELFVTKAVVKLPKKTNANRLSHHFMVDTSSDYSTMATHATTATKPHRQASPLSEEYYSSFLVTEKLYIDGLPNSVIETEIMDLVKSCCPERIYLNRGREFASGYIQFKSKEMADRAYTLLNGVTFRAGLRLQLKINPPSSDYPEPEAHAGILHIKNLPGHTNNNLLYELFRPFGPMILCKILVEQASTFKGTALVQYFNPQDAQDAESMMNNKSVQGNTISVFPIIPNSSSKPARSSVHSIETKDITLDTANTAHIATPPSPLPPTPAPMNNTASSPTSVIRSDGSSMVDYTNLYIKNLDLNVKSVDLFNNFRRFGRIISARVMKNAQTKQSKGFGFVSFSKADEAQKAKHEMNGEFILSKPVIVAFHEPKKAREADVSVSPTQSTFNGASRQQMVATSVSPHLVQHQQQQQQYNRLSPLPPPTPSFTSSPAHQNAYEQQQQQKQQSNGSGYYTNGNRVNNKNNTRTRNSIDQRYGNLTMPQQKYSTNGNSYQQTYTPSQPPPPAPPSSDGLKASHQPMERNNSNLSHHQHHQSSMGASNQYDPRQHQQQTNQYQGSSKKVYEPYQGQQHTYNTPIKRIPSATDSVQQPPSLSTLASGAFINTPQHTNATTLTSASTNNAYQHPNYYQQQHISPPPPQYHNANNYWSHSPHAQKQQQQERPSFRRRGSVESMASVMTETSSQTRRQTITKAVLAVEKSNDSNLNDIVDMLLTLRKKDLATCLFNKVFLKAKIKQAKDALEIFVEEQQQQQQPMHQNLVFHEPTVHMSSPPPVSTMVTNYYYQPKEEPAPSYIQHVALPPKGSRAIPIVAPPPAPTTASSPAAAAAATAAAAASPSKTGMAHSAKTASATNGASAAAPPSASNNKPSTSTNPKVLDSNTMNAQELSEEISKFLKTLDGLPLHEKKQSLGDRLFPLVKSTGVKQAPKITIRLLDSVPLDELAYTMYDKDKLKQQVSQISATISTKY